MTGPLGPETADARRRARPVRALFVVLGTVFLGLGAFGIVLSAWLLRRPSPPAEVAVPRRIGR